jgi:hypothetical protein
VFGIGTGQRWLLFCVLPTLVAGVASSIVAIVFRQRCLDPRPAAPIAAALLAGSLLSFYTLLVLGLAGMH